MKTVKKSIILISLILIAASLSVGKGLSSEKSVISDQTMGSIQSLPIFLPFFDTVTNDDYDVRDEFGRSVKSQTVKQQLRELFVFGLADMLLNANLPTTTRAVQIVEQILDLAAKVFGLPRPDTKLPGTPCLVSSNNKFSEKQKVVSSKIVVPPTNLTVSHRPVLETDLCGNGIEASSVQVLRL